MDLVLLTIILNNPFVEFLLLILATLSSAECIFGLFNSRLHISCSFEHKYILYIFSKNILLHIYGVITLRKFIEDVILYSLYSKFINFPHNVFYRNFFLDLGQDQIFHLVVSHFSLLFNMEQFPNLSLAVMPGTFLRNTVIISPVCFFF